VAEKLLFIDDEVGLTKVVGLIANEIGMEFKAVHTSRTATEVFIAYRPDVVILDIVMPGRDGIDVLNDIMNTGIRTEIVLTSGLSEGYLRLGESIARFHGVERVRVLKKPFGRSELIELLKDITDARPPTAIDSTHS
jgi:CheY-like chemotaxis protein